MGRGVDVGLGVGVEVGEGFDDDGAAAVGEGVAEIAREGVAAGITAVFF